jgi:integrase
MAVGRPRKDGNPLGLERRVYWHRGQWQYRHRTGRWEPLGTDVGRANARARLYNRPGGTLGTIRHWMQLYLADAAAGRLPAGRRKAPRTLRDNEKESGFLCASPLGAMLPQELARRPDLISEYRDRRVVDGRGKVRANRELSLLSGMFAWLIESGKIPGLTVNPVRLVSRFPEKPKERYVEDHEFRAVYGIAQRSVCMAMDLVYASLQRPGDVLRLAPSAVRWKAVGGQQQRVLSVQQGKTGRRVDIELTPALDAALSMLSNPEAAPGVPRLVRTVVHTPAGQPYTEAGIGAMLRRYCKRAGVQTFGLMDIRAKGATDMHEAGIPLAQIQALMGHASQMTTEVYIKRMLSTVRVARPNALAIGG